MNLLLKLFLFFGIYQIYANKLAHIDVLETLKTKRSSCNLKNFIESSDNTDDEYKIFIHDLTKYCSRKNSIPLYSLLCRMILIELEIACELPMNSRPKPIKYSISLTSSQICSMKRIKLINSWIWQKLTFDEKTEIGSTFSHLCPILSSSNSTLRLTRFFYKIASRIRRADLRHNIQLQNKDSSNSILKKIQIVGDVSLKKRNKTKHQINSIQQQTESKINQKNNNKNSINRVIPLERVGENPEHEQINERPKPKALELEMVFKSNDDEERNWIEGKYNADQLENHLQNKFKSFSRLKSANKSSNLHQLFRKKNSLKLKSKKYFDDNNDHDSLIDHFTTVFLVFILCIIIIYLILRNKNKILGLIVEGCKDRRAAYNRRIRLSQSSYI